MADGIKGDNYNDFPKDIKKGIKSIIDELNNPMIKFNKKGI